MSSTENRHIQEKPPPSPEYVDEVDNAFKMSDSEATKEAELSQRYERMNFLQKYMMELIFMFTMFPFMVMMVPQTAIFLKKSCEYNLGFNESICDNITDDAYKPYQDQAERVTKVIGLLKDLVTTLPGAISSVVAGQYMTRYGARIPMLVALVGAIVSSMGDMYTFLYMETPLYVNVLTAIPQALTGGVMVFMTAIFANITVTCPTEKRKTRFLMIQFFMFLPLVFAMLIGGPVFQDYGVKPLALGVGLCYLIPLFVLLFIYKNSGVSETAKKESFSEAWKRSTSLETFKKSLSYLTRKRPGHASVQIYCMFGCLLVGVMAFSGTGDLNQIYARHVYQWTPKQYGLINTITMIAAFVLAIPSMLILTKVFKLSDPSLIAVGFASFTLKYFIMGVMGLSEVLFYIQVIVGLPFIVGLTAIRSHVSRLLEQHEVAVIFALTSVCERMIPVVADIMVTAIYNSTNGFFAGLVYIVQGALFLIPMSLALLCLRWTTIEGYPEYTTLVEDNDDNNETGASCSNSPAAKISTTQKPMKT